MEDIRSTEPDSTGHRRARFRIGWAHAVGGREYGETVLDRLTWQNTGWRLGWLLGNTTPEMIERCYSLAVEQQTRSTSPHSKGDADPDAEPLRADVFDFSEPIATQYADAETVRRFEGGEILVANKDDQFQLIIDESSLADMLIEISEDDLLGSLVRVLHFATASSRDRYLTEHYPEQS